MSFRINWPKFTKEFLESAQVQLTEALNKGEEKPPNIVGKIVVQELYMGAKAPDLEILEIGELSEERFKGVFKLNYSGDGYIVMQTQVQANPLNENYSHRIIKSGKIYAANRPLVVPMQIKISNVKLRGVIVLVVDKHKGITLVFKNDPLERVDVHSTFDNIPNIKRLLQRQIESQLRKMFQDDLPQMVHQLSVLFIQQQQQKAKYSKRSHQTSSRSSYDYHSTTSDMHNPYQQHHGYPAHYDSSQYSTSRLSPPLTIDTNRGILPMSEAGTNFSFETSLSSTSAGGTARAKHSCSPSNLPSSNPNHHGHSSNNTAINGYTNTFHGIHQLSSSTKKTLTDEEMIKRPHNEKWSGNVYNAPTPVDLISPYFNPDMEGNVVLHNGLKNPVHSALSPTATQLGLKDVLEKPEEKGMPSSVSRIMSPVTSQSDLHRASPPNLHYHSHQLHPFSVIGIESDFTLPANIHLPILKSPLKQSILGSKFNDALLLSNPSTSLLSESPRQRQMSLDMSFTEETDEMQMLMDELYSAEALSTSLDPSRNQTAAHLMTLCRMYLTLSPREDGNQHATFRSSPRLAQLAKQEQDAQSVKVTRKIIRLKPPFSFRFNSSSFSSTGHPSRTTTQLETGMIAGASDVGHDHNHSRNGRKEKRRLSKRSTISDIN